MRSPVKWFGGKGKMVERLLTYIPRHRVYVEVYGGGAALLFAKSPSRFEVYNDLDSGLVHFFRVLRDPDKFGRFYHLACLTPFSEEEYYFCRETWEDTTDDVEKAYRWFVVARMSFSGRFGSGWGFVHTRERRGMAGACSNWLWTLEALPNIARRVMSVQIEHRDGLEVIKRHDGADTFFYLDPPYLASTRRAGRYSVEMTDDEHRAVLEAIVESEAMILVSGYPNDLYPELLRGWHYQEFETSCHAAGRTRKSEIHGDGSATAKQARTEAIWWNPQCEAGRHPPEPSFL